MAVSVWDYVRIRVRDAVLAGIEEAFLKIEVGEDPVRDRKAAEAATARLARIAATTPNPAAVQPNGNAGQRPGHKPGDDRSGGRPPQKSQPPLPELSITPSNAAALPPRKVGRPRKHFPS
ncbi:MAG: hypothetical protein M3552_12455 [Planctomycetota bacterium]|nr:hypothetical protein [Planctomycetaceae bacterium]MDQ3331445.1 hypothetical protein [Planctomycetota bacterium]